MNKNSHFNVRGKFTNVIRDFVFGMEDGLVSHLGIVLGMYVGGAPSFTIILAGSASMFAGAFSMSAGSYLSAKSQREVYEQEIQLTKEKLQKNPKQCLTEIGTILQQEGFDRNEIKIMCKHFAKHNQSTFVKNYIQKKVGLSETRFDLPLRNALMMFFSFLIGSFFPIAPFIFLSASMAVIITLLLTTLALFFVGWTKTIYTGRSRFKSGIEIVLVGLAAGIIGYFVGLLFRL